MTNSRVKLYIFAGILLFISVNAAIRLFTYEYVEEYITVKHLEEEVGMYERRYNALKPLIPRNELVGYITDEELDPRFMHLAEYCMSPFFITYYNKIGKMPIRDYQFRQYRVYKTEVEICGIARIQGG